MALRRTGRKECDVKTVLIVDDEYLIRWSLFEGLKGRFKVLTADSVDRAAEILSQFKVDALVTDLRMPGRGGMELVELARAHAPDIKVFIITAYGSDEVIDRAFALDVEGYVRKPFQIELIRDMLESHLIEPPHEDAEVA
jgi:YesN/AraC family two-component response regulator